MRVRDELAEAVIARLLLINQTGSLAPVLQPEAFDLGERLAEAINEDIRSAGGDGSPGDIADGGQGRTRAVDRAELRARHALGWLYWSQHNGLPDGAERDELRKGAVIALTPCFLDGVGSLPDPLLPALAEHAAQSATAILRLANRQPYRGFDQAVLDQAVDVWTRIAGAVAGQPVALAYLSNLCGALQARASRVGSAADLDAALATGRQMAAAAAEGHPLYAVGQNVLTGALRARYKHLREPGELDEAIDAARRAVAATPEPGSARRRYLINLAGVVILRFNRAADPADLREAVGAARESAMTTPAGSPYRGRRLMTLAEALVRRHRWSGLSTELDEAITAAASALDVGFGPNWDRAPALTMLVELLRLRAERAGREADIDAAVTLGRQVVALTPNSRPGTESFQWGKVTRLMNLAAALTTRATAFPGRSARADLDEAIDVGWSVVSIPAADALSSPSVARWSRRPWPTSPPR